MEDPYIWLEDVEGEEALAWVERQNEQSVAYIESLPMFDELYERSLEILDSDDRIAYPGIRGGHVFNFWRDATNPRGLWRRTTVDDYVAGDPDWDVILDLDALAEAEGEDWVWSGAACLRPDYRICMLELSRGGSDAAVMREFDVENRAFVDDGFVVPEAKSRVSWVDSDALYIGTDFGEGTLTDSGYARTVRTWRRGEPLSDATEIFAGEQTDVAANLNRRWDGDSSYDIAARSVSFYTSTSYLVTDEGEFKLIDIPEDASLERVFNGQMLVALKSDWTVGGETFVQGSLIAADFEKFLQGERDFHVLFVPTPTTALVDGGVTATRDYLILNVLEDVASRLVRYELRDGEWISHDIDTEALGSIRVVAASDTSNILFFSYENFLTPDTLHVSRDGGASIEPLQSLPEFFDADGVSVEQRFATSSDGTRIPYFVVLPAGFEANGDTPTLLYGYGGFEISLTPGYSSIAGHSWIARGGAYVIANIRGGGEYGPRWHQGRAEGQPATRFRRLHRGCGGSDRPWRDEPPSPRNSRRFKRRSAHGRDADAAAGSLQRGDRPGALARHEALQPASGGRVLDGRVRQSGYGGLGIHQRIFAVPERSTGRGLSETLLHHFDPRRPRAPGPRAKDGRADDGDGTRFALFRKYGRRTRRRLGQCATGQERGHDL